MRIGAARVDVSLRELRGRDGAGPVRRLTPKAVGVLLELASRPGQVVGREELLARVWPDTLPTDDVLTQAITQLRKAYGATVGPEPFIQTIAKSGYRLVVPVEWLSAGAEVGRAGAGEGPGTDSPADRADASRLIADARVPGAEGAIELPPPDARPIRRRTRLRSGWFGVAAVAVLGLAAVWLRPGIDPATQVDAPRVGLRTSGATAAVQRVTSAPGAESAPTLSPDGRVLVYVAIPSGGESPVLHVQAVDGALGTPLTAPPASAADGNPAFSPDGRRIAYRRSWLDGRCEVRIVDAAGTSDRRVATCPPGAAGGLDWSPDASRLVTAHTADPVEPTRLHVLDIATGRWAPLATGAAATDVETMPRFTADGRGVVFVRNPQGATLWRVAVEGGIATPVARLGADVRSWHWLGQGAVLLSRFVDGDYRLTRVRLANGATLDLGQSWAREPAVARGSPWIAFVQGSAAYDLMRARVPADGPSAHVLEPVLPSTGREVLPSLAPDGDALLFVSDRHGAGALWSARLSDPSSLRRIPGLTPQVRHAAVWAADARRALVPAYDTGGRPRVAEYDAGTRTAHVLPVPVAHPLQAAYGLPGEVLVVTDREGPSKLLRFDRRTTPWRLLAEWPDATRVRVAGGRAWFTRTGHAGLWSLPLTLEPADLRHEDPLLPARGDDRNWEVDAQGHAWVIQQVPGCATHLRRIGAAPRSGRCLDMRHRAAVNGFAMAPDARVVLFSGVSAEEGDIALMASPPG